MKTPQKKVKQVWKCLVEKKVGSSGDGNELVSEDSSKARGIVGTGVTNHLTIPA